MLKTAIFENSFNPIPISFRYNSDYYPYGSAIQELQYSYSDGLDTSKYRFGFNMQEGDYEIAGEGNIYTAEFWEYDARLGRRWNKDFVVKTNQAVYSCFNNNPIVFSDPFGLDGVPRQHETKKGDTYSSISKTYGVSVENLRKWNKYADTKIPIGVKLNVSDPTKDLLLGTRGKVGTGEDSQSGKNGIPSSAVGKDLVNDDVNDGVDELSKDYKECNDLAIDNTFNIDWYTIRDKFLEGNGGLVGNLSTIENEMKNSLTGLKLAQDIDNYFQSEMIKYNGNYSLINFSNANFNPPGFSGVSNTMLALVGGTQQLDVYLTSIIIHEQTYIATVTYILFDDYGVSEEDFLKANTTGGILSGCREGLVSMWILQHCYGYKPLTTSFKFTTTIIGSF